MGTYIYWRQMSEIAPEGSPRRKLIDAALYVIRAQGYAAATVDDICGAAGVTKGSFFHHFKGKDHLALAAIEHWSAWTGEFFAGAPYQALKDPRQRVFAYVDFRAALINGDIPRFTCPLGVLMQETYDSHPDLREACRNAIARHVSTVEAMLAEAKQRYAPMADWAPADVAAFTQSVLQGGFILAKAEGDAGPAIRALATLRRFIDLLLPLDIAQNA